MIVIRENIFTRFRDEDTRISAAALVFGQPGTQFEVHLQHVLDHTRRIAEILVRAHSLGTVVADFEAHLSNQMFRRGLGVWGRIVPVEVSPDNQIWWNRHSTEKTSGDLRKVSALGAFSAVAKWKNDTYNLGSHLVKELGAHSALKLLSATHFD